MMNEKQTKRMPSKRVIDAEKMCFKTLNENIRAAVERDARKITLKNVLGHRYIACGLTGGVEIIVDGVPGNDLACFMNGARVVVNGNAQDGVANTMSCGDVVIHGDVGDVLGYAMRGGRVFVLGNAGYRVGIHMKAFKEKTPVVVIGGTTMDYFGEYMAGGTLIVLGLRNSASRLTGDFLGTGMHGGEIFIRGKIRPHQLGKEIGAVKMNNDDIHKLNGHLRDFTAEFNLNRNMFDPSEFTRLIPVSHRPYGKIYVY